MLPLNLAFVRNLAGNELRDNFLPPFLLMLFLRIGISLGEVLPGKPLDSLEFGELESFKDFFFGRDPLFLKGKKEKFI